MLFGYDNQAVKFAFWTTIFLFSVNSISIFTFIFISFSRSVVTLLFTGNKNQNMISQFLWSLISSENISHVFGNSSIPIDEFLESFLKQKSIIVIIWGGIFKGETLETLQNYFVPFNTPITCKLKKSLEWYWDGERREKINECL